MPSERNVTNPPENIVRIKRGKIVKHYRSAHAVGSNMALKNAVGDRITTYCIFDSDYHTKNEQTERYHQAVERGINLHIWRRKEIENYLLAPTVIARVIKQRTKTEPPTPAQVQAFLQSACEEEKGDCL